MLAGTLIAETQAAGTHKDYHFNVGPKGGSFRQQSLRLDLGQTVDR